MFFLLTVFGFQSVKTAKKNRRNESPVYFFEKKTVSKHEKNFQIVFFSSENSSRGMFNALRFHF
ncbi:MAG: hypothetical protein CL510_10210 [Actinobacteria bacterium]|nr:hypothetical protein [Actinomycetota bacterium]